MEKIFDYYLDTELLPNILDLICETQDVKWFTYEKFREIVKMQNEEILTTIFKKIFCEKWIEVIEQTRYRSFVKECIQNSMTDRNELNKIKLKMIKFITECEDNFIYLCFRLDGSAILRYPSDEEVLLSHCQLKKVFIDHY